jgi:hypothetical protein
MGLNLKAYREITNGFARHHHFSIGFADWRGLGLTGGIVSKIVGTAASPILNAFVSSMEVPSKTVSSTPVVLQHGLPAINVASDVAYGKWTVEFYSDELMLIRYFLLEWMELVANSKNHTIGLPAQYKSNLAYGAILTPSDIPVQVFSFKGLYPVDVGGIQMDQDNTQIIKFNVTFEYDYFQINEPFGLGLAFGMETLGSVGLNSAFSGTTGLKKRKLNAPLGIEVPLPF